MQPSHTHTHTHTHAHTHPHTDTQFQTPSLHPAMHNAYTHTHACGQSSHRTPREPLACLCVHVCVCALHAAHLQKELSARGYSSLASSDSLGSVDMSVMGDSDNEYAPLQSQQQSQQGPALLPAGRAMSAEPGSAAWTSRTLSSVSDLRDSGDWVSVRAFLSALQSVRTGDSPVSGSKVRTERQASRLCVCVCVYVGVYTGHGRRRRGRSLIAATHLLPPRSCPRWLGT